MSDPTDIVQMNNLLCTPNLEIHNFLFFLTRQKMENSKDSYIIALEEKNRKCLIQNIKQIIFVISRQGLHYLLKHKL